MVFFQKRIQKLPFIVATFTLLYFIGALCAEQEAGEQIFATRAQKIFKSSQTRWKTEPTNLEAATKFAQAAFDWAEFSQDNKQREEIALSGIEACRKIISSQSNSAAAHYYLSMNLGQLARTKSLGALKLVSEMEMEFQTARNLDEQFDFAGPDRNLGLLYAEAPGWPTSIGNRSKSRHHLQRAVLLKPGYPENRLNLLEAYLKWSDRPAAEREFFALKELWPAAKKELSGEQWEASWADWTKRWEKVQSKFAPSHRDSSSPKNKK